jgi:hypothetical protein
VPPVPAEFDGCRSSLSGLGLFENPPFPAKQAKAWMRGQMERKEFGARKIAQSLSNDAKCDSKSAWVTQKNPKCDSKAHLID